MNPYAYLLQNQYGIFIANQLVESQPYQTPNICIASQSHSQHQISPKSSEAVSDFSQPKTYDRKRNYDNISQHSTFYPQPYQPHPVTIEKLPIEPTNTNLSNQQHLPQATQNGMWRSEASTSHRPVSIPSSVSSWVFQPQPSSLSADISNTKQRVFLQSSTKHCPISAIRSSHPNSNHLHHTTSPKVENQFRQWKSPKLFYPDYATNGQVAVDQQSPEYATNGQVAVDQQSTSSSTQSQNDSLFRPLLFHNHVASKDGPKPTLNNSQLAFNNHFRNHLPQTPIPSINQNYSPNKNDKPIDLSRPNPLNLSASTVAKPSINSHSNNSLFIPWTPVTNNYQPATDFQYYPHLNDWSYQYNLVQNMNQFQNYNPSSSNPTVTNLTHSNSASCSALSYPDTRKQSFNKSPSSSSVSPHCKLPPKKRTSPYMSNGYHLSNSEAVYRAMETNKATEIISSIDTSPIKQEAIYKNQFNSQPIVTDGFLESFSPLFSSSPVKIPKSKRSQVKKSLKRTPKSAKVSNLLKPADSDPPETPAEDSNVIDCIIIGAGVSGLAAAQVLQRKGMRCVVLEARDRHGGRIHTVTRPSQDQEKPHLIEMGANYIHGCINDQWAQPMFVLASRLNVPTAITPGDVDKPYRGWENPEIAIWRDHKTGKEVPRETISNMTLLFDSTMSRLSQKIAQLETAPYEVPLEKLLTQVKEKLLTEMCIGGLRPTAQLNETESGVFESLVSRFVSYVNPMSRLSALISENKYLEVPQRHDDQNETENSVDLIAKKLTFIPSITDYTQTLNLPNRKKGRRSKAEDNGKDVSVRMKRLLHDNWLDYYHTIWEKKWDTLLKLDSQSEVAKRVHRKWEDRLVLGGYSSLTDRLAKQLDIRYKSVVTKIDWSSAVIDDSNKSGGTIRVESCHLDQREARDTLLCRYCIVTLPVGVLKGLHADSKVEFVPALPDNKRNAIDKLGIPHVGAETHDKVILHFASHDIFWDRNSPQLKCPDSRLHVLNLDWYDQSGILLCHVWGGSGLKIYGRSDEEVVEELMTLLRGMYSQSEEVKPDWTIVTRWSEDCFSLGSYTEGEIGSSDEDRHAYAASLPSNGHPKLLFAGEGTIDSTRGQQCTHGAFMSGVDRACDILRHRHGNTNVPISRIVDFVSDTQDQKQTRRKYNKLLPSKLKTTSDSPVDLFGGNDSPVCPDSLEMELCLWGDVVDSTVDIVKQDAAFLRQLAQREDIAANTSMESDWTLPCCVERSLTSSQEVLDTAFDSGRTLPGLGDDPFIKFPS